MVPDNYHDFFLGTASIAGALIGLLFVAISVAPDDGHGKQLDVERNTLASAALSAFLIALVLSAVALIPGTNLGSVSRILAMISIFSTVMLLVRLLAYAWKSPEAVLNRWQTARSSLVLVAMVGLYVFQMLSGFRLRDDPTAETEVDNQAIVVIVLFVVGISWAWQLVGTRPPRLLETLRHTDSEIVNESTEA